MAKQTDWPDAVEKRAAMAIRMMRNMVLLLVLCARPAIISMHGLARTNHVARSHIIEVR